MLRCMDTDLQMQRPAASHWPRPRHRRSQAGCGPKARHSFLRRSFRGVPASFRFLEVAVVAPLGSHLERISSPMEKEAMPVRLPVQGRRTEKAGRVVEVTGAHLRAYAGSAPSWRCRWWG